MSDANQDDTSARKRRRGAGRRTALRVLAAVGLGGGLARLGLRAAQSSPGNAQPRPPAGVKVVVTERCVGCTGCVVVCPTAAIDYLGGAIRVDQELCVSCGYCQIGCSVDGIRVVRGNTHG
jgi:ferredoxin